MYKHKPFLKCELRKKNNSFFLEDEEKVVKSLLEHVEIDPLCLQRIQFSAGDLVEHVRESKKQQGSIEAFIQEYDISTDEGTVLMCLAEALLRIPDNGTADKLIKDKLSPAQWNKHLGQSQSLFVNASTWGLMLGSKLIKTYPDADNSWEIISHLKNRVGEPIVRTALKQAMRIMGTQFVMQTSIEAAIQRSQKEFHSNYRFSYDMLGEAALSTKDADRYFKEYLNALEIIAKQRDKFSNIYEAPSLSIKLSALHPRYEVAQYQRVMDELLPKVKEIVTLAKQFDIAITLDAEETDRLDLSLDILEKLFSDKTLQGWNGLGLAVQAYQKRAYSVLEWLKQQAKDKNFKIPIRLVKGAYWDTEIKRAQERGLSDYPVFTRKVNTDISYIACAKFMLDHSTLFYPQFATHNAHTIATVIELAEDTADFEFQRLHGMGQTLYDTTIDKHPCRIYSPVGGYKDLLPYLVRRLLENGANTSFVNRIENPEIPIENIIENPIDKLERFESIHNSNIPKPIYLYGANRPNSIGPNVNDYACINDLLNKIQQKASWLAKPLIGKEHTSGKKKVIHSPFEDRLIGEVQMATEEEIKHCLANAFLHYDQWKNSSLENRITIIQSFAELLEKNKTKLYSLCIQEAGKTLNDAISEVREAIDFCYYYIEQAKLLFGEEDRLPGPTGEKNVLQLHGRGIFVCISPWNFPLAIFIGQIVAAFISGNTVIAKPSSNSSLIAYYATKLLFEAGADENYLYYLPCQSDLLEKTLLSDHRINGVAFTGSMSAASQINRTLANRETAIAPLIAETGGQNAMIVDSSAFMEQVAKDVIASAFYSAGQRCSALRILLVQEDIKESLIGILCEAMQELVIGPPSSLDTDIPPVIDENAKNNLNEYKNAMKDSGKLIFELITPNNLIGHYVNPSIFEINSFSDLSGEQFGPFLHVMSYKSSNLEDVINEINNLGYGLTLGIHSRIDETINYISKHANVGNIYINRNMIGAVVGVQPFGGEGLSGTGPKAGGPNYLQRFCTEKTISTNTSAIGGNTDLLNLSDS